MISEKVAPDMQDSTNAEHAPWYQQILTHGSKKLLVFIWLIDRMPNLPFTNYKKELQTIKTLAKNNGYQEMIIDRLLVKK